MVHLRLAFATDRDASVAVSMLQSGRHLIRRAVRRRAATETEVAVVDLEFDADNRDRVLTLASGAHGVPVDSGGTEPDVETVATADGVVLT